MSETNWFCGICETSNDATDATCRNCGRAPVTATGTIRLIVEALPPRQIVNTTDLNEPGYEDADRATIFLTPPASALQVRVLTPASVPARPARSRPIAALEAPRPTAPPTAPRVRRSASKTSGWTIFIAFAACAIVIIVVLATTSSVTSSNSAGSAPTGTQVACPADVAQWLPNDGANAQLIAQYNDDDNHIITICVDSSTSQYYYDGQLKGAPVNSDTHISLPATPDGTDFVASNGAYQYRLTGSEVTVTKNGTTIMESKLTQIAP